jgi:preprotein translocase subunit SecF
MSILSRKAKEFDLQIITALLTIIGYSLNDTIVIFDRIRENLRGQRCEQFPVVVNRSMTQTLSRTLLTLGYTLLVVVAFLLLRGEVLHDFAFALLVGMIAGTYSTVFIASPLLGTDALRYEGMGLAHMTLGGTADAEGRREDHQRPVAAG